MVTAESRLALVDMIVMERTAAQRYEEAKSRLDALGLKPSALRTLYLAWESEEYGRWEAIKRCLPLAEQLYNAGLDAPIQDVVDEVITVLFVSGIVGYPADVMVEILSHLEEKAHEDRFYAAYDEIPF